MTIPTRPNKAARRALCLLSLGLLLHPSLGQAAKQDRADPVIAEVGDQTMTESDFARMIAALPPESRRKAATDHAALLQLVRGELGRRAVLGEARTHHWDRKPEIAARAQRAAEDVVITSFLDTGAVPPASFPEDALVRRVYQANLSRFMQPRQYHLAQIYVARPAGAVQAAAAQRRVEALAQSAAAGSDFTALAAKSSDDKETAAHGGDLGWVSEKLMIPQIAKAVSGLDDGEVSGAVALADGWHILRMLGTKPPAPAPFETVKPTIVAMLREQETARLEQAHVDDLLSRGHAEVDLERVQELLAKQR